MLMRNKMIIVVSTSYLLIAFTAAVVVSGNTKNYTGVTYLYTLANAKEIMLLPRVLYSYDAVIF